MHCHSSIADKATTRCNRCAFKLLIVATGGHAAGIFPQITPRQVGCLAECHSRRPGTFMWNTAVHAQIVSSEQGMVLQPALAMHQVRITATCSRLKQGAVPDS